MPRSMPDGWVELGRGRHPLRDGRTLMLNKQSAILSSEVQDWFRDRGYSRVRFVQNPSSGAIAIVGSEDGGYQLTRRYIGGGRAVRRALGIADDEPHYFVLEPSNDFDGMILTEDTRG